MTMTMILFFSSTEHVLHNTKPRWPSVRPLNCFQRRQQQWSLGPRRSRKVTPFTILTSQLPSVRQNAWFLFFWAAPVNLILNESCVIVYAFFLYGSRPYVPCNARQAARWFPSAPNRCKSPQGRTLSQPRHQTEPIYRNDLRVFVKVPFCAARTFLVDVFTF